MQARGFYRSLFAIALAVVAESSLYAEEHITEEHVFEHHISEKNDAYHFKFWQGSPYNAAYAEWW